MFNYIWPLLIIVFANTLYQICAKGIPVQMNTYASMTITYAVATLFSALVFFVTTKGGNILKEFSHTNWATIVLSWSKVLGVAIYLVGLYFINRK
jgi:hypothetical protein